MANTLPQSIQSQFGHHTNINGLKYDAGALIVNLQYQPLYGESSGPTKTEAETFEVHLASPVISGEREINIKGLFHAPAVSLEGPGVRLKCGSIGKEGCDGLTSICNGATGEVEGEALLKQVYSTTSEVRSSLSANFARLDCVANADIYTKDRASICSIFEGSGVFTGGTMATPDHITGSVGARIALVIMGRYGEEEALYGCRLISYADIFLASGSLSMSQFSLGVAGVKIFGPADLVAGTLPENIKAVMCEAQRLFGPDIIKIPAPVTGDPAASPTP